MINGEIYTRKYFAEKLNISLGEINAVMDVITEDEVLYSFKELLAEKMGAVIITHQFKDI